MNEKKENKRDKGKARYKLNKSLVCRFTFIKTTFCLFQSPRDLDSPGVRHKRRQKKSRPKEAKVDEGESIKVMSE